MKTMTLVLVGILAQYLAASAGEVSFASKPTAKKNGATTTISFAAGGKTDVAVYVLDAKGKCVRHLAAGVLGGEKAPPEPLKAGLSQGLEWDGKDDYGKPAAGGPFKVRVALGLKPEFAGFLNFNPDALPKTFRVAVGPGGSIYYFYQDPVSNFNMGGHKVRVRSREGKHLRTLVPFSAPADLKPSEIAAFGALKDEGGWVVPRIHNWESMSLQPTTAGGRKRDTACYTPVVDSKGRLYWTVQGERLVCVDAQGRCPYPTYLGKPLLPGATYSPWSGSTSRYLALSGDEKHVYISAVTGLFGQKKTQVRHCVYRTDVATRGEARPFVGDPAKAGGGKSLLSSPRGVATAGGLLYVADRGNDRVVAFKEEDGSYAGELKTPKPYHVSVDRKTGALYVISEPKPMFSELLKFDGLDAKAPSKKMELPKDWSKRGPWTMALDVSAKPARLYFPTRGYAGPAWGKAIVCLEDGPDGFKGVDVPTPKGRYAFSHKDLWIDQRRGELYIKADKGYDRFDAETGEYKDSMGLKGSHGPSGGQVVADSQGRLVMYCWVHKNARPALSLWTRDGKPISTKGEGWSGVMTFQQKFMDITPNDELYVRPGTKGKVDWPAGSPGGVTVFDMNLRPKRTLIWQCSDGCVVKTDIKGNIYLGENVRPLKRMIPEFFDGKLKPVKDQGIGGTDWYSYMYGSIVKFSPKGGSVWFDRKAEAKAPAEIQAMPRQPFNFRTRHKGPRPPGDLQGAEWTRFGFAPYASTYGGGTPRCQCEGSGFDVDGFGRVFYPSLGRFRVEVIDNNNNLIGTFGKYGNADSQLVPTGSKDAEPLVSVPKIPLSWPTYVAAGDNFAYVADVVGMRTVKVRLNYAAEEICVVP